MTVEQRDRPRGLASIRGYLHEAAARFGTPVYVMDEVTVAQSAALVEAAFPDPWIRQYSMKANDLPAIAGLLADRGWGANVVSAGEWAQASLAGVDQETVTFEGIGKTDAELEWAAGTAALGTPLRWLAVESASEALQLAAFAKRHGLGRNGRPPVDVLLRLNPQVRPETLAVLAVGSGTSKFGMDRADIMALAAQDLSSSGLRIRGIHVHVGSDLRDVGAWVDAGVRAVRLLADVSAYVDGADTVDFGGGFPLEGPAGTPTPGQFHDALLRALDVEGLHVPPRCAVEPGRYLVGAAGWLVSSVLHSRSRTSYARQVVLDAGMTELIRPALYGSRHPVHPLATGHPDDGTRDETAVEGPVCESTDSFGAHALPPLQRGDLVAIENAGAYAASFTSRYNGRPQPAEVLLTADGALEHCERAEIARLRLPPSTAEARHVQLIS